MKKKQGKSNQKKQLEEQAEKQRDQRESNQRQARERQEQLEKRSSPLIETGLIDAFQFFMVQLTQAGIPQSNVFEFAAQMVLKYEKNMKRKIQEVSQVNEFNERAIKQSPKVENKEKGKKSTIKPSLLPFKSELTEEEKKIIEKAEEEK